MEYEIGKIYDRRKDIHAKFDGQQQGGISTPANAPYIFLFTGDSGEQYGYKDGLDQDGVYLYTGEGQLGNMQFVRGNLAIRDHSTNGKDLLLFSSRGKGKGYRYMGVFACANFELRQAPDRDGHQREVIVFHLVPIDDYEEQLHTPTEASKLSIEQLRKKAYAAASNEKGIAGRDAKTIYRARSRAVKDYVLARAEGFCESCKKPAPFKKVDDSHYLEPHHTRRLSDGGPDDPKWVGAICPNCHREIHFGANGSVLNTRLQNYISSLENNLQIGNK